MAFCTKCGAQVPDGSAFCTSCGSPVGAPIPQQPAQEAAPAPQPAQEAAPAPIPAPQPQYQQQYQQQQAYQAPQFNNYDHTLEFDPADIKGHKTAPCTLYLFTAAILYMYIADNSIFSWFAAISSIFTNLFSGGGGQSATEMLVFLVPPVLSILLLYIAKDSPYTVFHANQVLKITMIFFLGYLVEIVPFLGYLVHYVFAWILLVVTLISFFQTLGGKAKEPAIVRAIIK